MSTPSLFFSQWTLTPSVLAPAIAFAALYLIAVARAGGRWPVHRTISHLAGIGCALVALQSGIDAYDDQLLSDHMVQHMLLLVAAPPLLLAGRPLILALQSIPPRGRRRLTSALARGRRFSGPIPSLGLFGTVILLTHLPAFYDATLRHPALHEAEHALYLAAGLLMFSPLLDGDPAPRHRMSGLGKLVYVIVAMMPMAVVGAYLNRHATLVYPPYGPPAHMLGVSALDDQAQAGAIMWVAGGVIMTAIGLWAALAAMLAEERRLVDREARAASVINPDGGSPA